MQKTCPRCGKTFECLADDISRCHCAHIALDAQRKAALSRYKGCLCAECLRNIK